MALEGGGGGLALEGEEWDSPARERIARWDRERGM
jgi:hypothetical protein